MFALNNPSPSPKPGLTKKKPGSTGSRVEKGQPGGGKLPCLEIGAYQAAMRLKAGADALFERRRSSGGM